MRLIQLGFTQVYRYVGGKEDWLANGLPFEGSEANAKRAGDLARMDVPTCRMDERLRDIHQRTEQAGWDSCVVINDERVVMGLLLSHVWEGDLNQSVEQVMDPDARTYRLNHPLEKVIDYMNRHNVDSVLISNTDGQLFGLLKRSDVENEVGEKNHGSAER